MQTHCSRYVNGHMKQHGTETGHSLVLSYADISVWCYQCDSYVHHPVSCICACASACMRACVPTELTYMHFRLLLLLPDYALQSAYVDIVQ